MKKLIVFLLFFLFIKEVFSQTPGCTDATACNYNSLATLDDGSCTFATNWYLDNDGDSYGTAGVDTWNIYQPGNSSIVISNNTIVIVGVDGINTNGQYSTAFVTLNSYNPGPIDFDWLYVTSDISPMFDPASVWSGSFPSTTLSDPSGSTTQSGSSGAYGIPNGAIGFSVASNNSGGSATLTITNLSGYSYPIVNACVQPTGYVSNNFDCNDWDSNIYPGGIDTICNGSDDDCDGMEDEGLFHILYFLDADGDGFGDPSFSEGLCPQYVPDYTYSLVGTDCNDFDPAVNPGTTELCNGVDDNCSNQIDEGLLSTYYADTDVDGYGDAGSSVQSCTQPAGYLTDNADCNDSNAAVNPGATEVCNGVDDNCNNQIDEGLLSTYYADTDVDGYGDAASSVQSCTQPAGYLTDNTDCNDTNVAVNPGATEVCNGIDDNCNNQIDEGLLSTYYADTDFDGYGAAGSSVQACSQPAGYVTTNTDCNNSNAAVNPGATEVCNGIDENCNNQIDEGLTFTNYYVDTDGDGYGAGTATNACSQPAGYVTTNTDCNNSNAAVNPGTTESCNTAYDDNCNGLINEGCQVCPGGENPSTATPITPALWPNCSTPVSCTLVNALISSDANTFCLTGEDKWHQFVATSEGISIVVSSAGNDIVIELQTAAGVLVAQENAVFGLGGEILNQSGLTAGQVYKIGVRNYNSALGAGPYTICAKMLKRGGCDYPAGPYTLCQNFKATWTGAVGTSYTFTFTGLSGPALGNVYTRTQSSDYCLLSSVFPTLPYGSNYNVLITNTYPLLNAAGVVEYISVPALSPCTMITSPQPLTALKINDRCAAGPRNRGAFVTSIPWVCGISDWRWEFTEVNSMGSPIAAPIAVNRGAASNLLNLGTVLQLAYGKTYSVRTAPLLSYTGTSYQWGAAQCMSICSSNGSCMVLDSDGRPPAPQTEKMDKAYDVNLSLYPNPTQGASVNINLTGVESENVHIRIIDAMGRQVWSNRYSVSGVLNTNITFERPLARGLYLVEAIFNSELQTQRMLVQ
jgi:hypothetical protein